MDKLLPFLIYILYRNTDAIQHPAARFINRAQQCFSCTRRVCGFVVSRVCWAPDRQVCTLWGSGEKHIRLYPHHPMGVLVSRTVTGILAIGARDPKGGMTVVVCVVCVVVAFAASSDVDANERSIVFTDFKMDMATLR